MATTDRRRLPPPPGGTTAPIYIQSQQPTHSRTRPPDQPRKLHLRTSFVPSASGSAYLELEPHTASEGLFGFSRPSLKLAVTVHGPRPLPRQTPYSSTMILNTYVKFAPFATKRRRGWVRDNAERDLGAHLETALRGAILAERLPKSCCDVVVTVIEGEEEGEDGGSGISGLGIMNVLAGCITASSAALVDAGIECIDLVAGGMVAKIGSDFVVDPVIREHEDISAAAVVGYLESRDELTEVWVKGDLGIDASPMIDKTVEAARMSRAVLAEVLREAVAQKLANQKDLENGAVGP